jgi:hypothetical protein
MHGNMNLKPGILLDQRNLVAETPWLWHHGAETFKSWHLKWSVSGDLFYCNLITENMESK